MNNWYGGWLPVNFADAPTEKLLSKRKLFLPISQIQALTKEHADGSGIGLPFPPGALKQLGIGNKMAAVEVDATALIGVVDSVRTAVLNWSLQLEKQGILGQGMTFSEREKESAKNIIYNIENFTGVFGDVSADTIVIGKNIEILSKIKELNLPEMKWRKLMIF